MTAEQLIGQQLGHYTIEAIVGSGGMSVVYRARDPEENDVALKVLFPPPDTEAETLARFEREARTAAKLRHPNLVPVFDTGQADGRAYLAMAFIEGQTLSRRLARVGRLDESAAADIAWQIADALYYAHGQGIVHRDIKPSNILLTDTGQALLTDFGVAQAFDDPALTRTGYTVGTPAYMSPEQAAGDRSVDGRSDLYSLGVVLYQMVTSRLPFQGGTPHVLHAHVYSPPPPPSTIAEVSPGMERIILRALAKKPEQRFQTGLALAHALNDLEDQTGRHDQSPAASSQQKRGERSRLIAGLIAVVILLIGGTAFAAWQFAGGADQPTPSPSPSLVVAFSTSMPTDQPTAPSTPTASATPTRPLPSPTPTPLEPTATPSPSSLSPTSTATPPPTEPPLALTCPQSAADVLAAVAEGNLRDQIGCPAAEAVTTAAAWQPFERGELLWREDRSLIYILKGDNSWEVTGNEWQGEPEPVLDPDLIPPADDLQVPVRGFGRAWRDQNLVADLGWALAPEMGFTATIQIFDNAELWHNPTNETVTLLFDDDTYRLIDETGSGE